MRRFRFAPTPSRPIHAGSALAALFGWGFARAVNGTLIMRIEDIDRDRCRPEHEVRLLEDLSWLGIDWDEGPDVGGRFGPYRQSERAAHYDAALVDLAERGVLYPCTCSRNDIRRALSAPHTHDGQVPSEGIYPGTCALHTMAIPLAPDRGGLRLRLDALPIAATIGWHDGILGGSCEDLRETTGDFLLGRPHQATYQLASVVDDIAMGVTDVVRGRDLAGSTARQIALRAALGHGAPRYYHHPLLVDGVGMKLSKRDEATPLADLRAQNADRGALIATLGRAVGVFKDDVRVASPHDFRDAVAPWAAAVDNGPLPEWRDGRLEAV